MTVARTDEFSTPSAEGVGGSPAVIVWDSSRHTKTPTAVPSTPLTATRSRCCVMRSSAYRVPTAPGRIIYFAVYGMPQRRPDIGRRGS
jgi:hypothetical protein